MQPPTKPLVLILCTGNSCRSHMAEGILRQAAGDLLEVRSAGSTPAGYVHPLAIRAMAEIGIDISGHRSKHLAGFLQQNVETVITVCGNADQACPIFPGQLNRHHWGFDDPAHAPGGEEEQLAVFRHVRDAIKRVFAAYADGRRDAAQATATCSINMAAQRQPQDHLMPSQQTTDNSDRIREQVRQGYATIATSGNSCCSSKPTCCGSSPAAAAELVRHIGYTAQQLAALPDGANMGLSCGNPNAIAALQPGEVVLDLGAGGGFDVFIASRNVGPTGRAIGVDMTPEMLAKARRNLESHRARTGIDNVEFRLGEIEHLPVPDHSVDVVISNCVINLAPDKPQVWREICRVLKPGGRVAVSDLALLKPLPAEVLAMVEALVGCVAGAALVSATERMAREAGLTDIVLTAKPQYVEAMTSFDDPLYQKIVAQLPAGTKPSDYIVSLEVQARKPAKCR